MADSLQSPHVPSGGQAYPRLFSPFRLGPLTLRNRVVMAPMSSSLADADGQVTPELVAFLRERAAGGVGMVVVEFTCVDAQFGLGDARQLRIDTDAHVIGHARLVEAIVANGAIACLQLHLPGQYVVGANSLPVAPSDVFARDGRQIARALTDAEVRVLVRRFAEAAGRAVRAGYQAIEVHGAHGYLPMAFLSPRKNHRDDAWGGDFERRIAFPLAVIGALREVLGNALPLLYRLSAAEFVEPGLTLDDMLRVAARLAKAGCSAIDVSSGTIEGALDRVVDPMSSAEGWRFPLARRLREAAGIPVLVVGPVRWPATAEQALSAGDADLIGLGRPLLADPAWADKARRDDLKSITPCTSCNWCMERVRRHLPVGCAESPRTGNETIDDLASDRSVGTCAVVVGAGPAGLHAALELDRLGFSTHLFEERPSVGGGLEVSAAPPFKGPLRWYQEHLRHRLTQSGVVLHAGRRAYVDDLLALHPALAIVATGSRGRFHELEMTDAALALMDANDLLNGLCKPDGRSPLVVYGGGETGCESAEFLAARGLEVKLVTRSGIGQLARAAEPMYRRQLLARLTQNPLVEIVTETTVVCVEAQGVRVATASGDLRFLPAAGLVVAQGREPATDLLPSLQRAGITCAAVGDAHAIGRIGDAVHAAHRAVHDLARAVLRPGQFSRDTNAPAAPLHQGA